MGVWKKLFGGANDENSQQHNQLVKPSDDVAAVLTVTLLNQQSEQLQQQGQYEQAISAATQACDIARQKLGELHPLFANSLHNLGKVYSAMGRHAEAEPLYHQALEIIRTNGGEEHP